MASSIDTKRKVWVDWMKALGMLAIIWGHCFPEGVSGFIYSFNVPVFFIISGFLTKREESMKVCFQKTCSNLIIPYFILAFIKVAGYIFKHLDDGQWLWSVIAIFGGFHKLHDASGCSNLWFVYSLILIKFIYQAFATGKVQMLAISALAVVGALIYNMLGLDWMWSVTNVMLALPFFMLGNWLATYGRARFDELFATLKASHGRVLLMLVFALAITAVVGRYNDAADMFQNQYGNYFVLFVIGSLSGSFMVFLLSVLLDNFNWNAVRITSMGTIVTLVFHRELLHSPLKMIKRSGWGIVPENIAIFLLSVAVLLAFIPIILIVKRILPIVFGRRIKKA